MQKIPSYILVLLLCSFWLVSCGLAAERDAILQGQSVWETAQPDEEGIDGEILSELVSRISNEEFQNIHSILIVIDDKLVFEQYFPGYA